MQKATVTVDFVNPPKDGKKFGSIKTKELGYVSVWPDKLDNFKKGQKYTIQYETTDSGYHNFKAMAGGDFPDSDLGDTGVAPPPLPKPNYQTAPSRPVDPTPERIFVCGIVNSAVSSGRVELDRDAIIALVNEARSAWRETLGK